MNASIGHCAVRKREVVIERVGGTALLHEDAARACRRARRRARCSANGGIRRAAGCATAARTGRSSSMLVDRREIALASADAACRRGSMRVTDSSVSDWPGKRRNVRSPPFQSPSKTMCCVSTTCSAPSASSRALTSNALQRSARVGCLAPRRAAPRAAGAESATGGRETRGRIVCRRLRERALHSLSGRRATGTTNRIEVSRGENAAILLSTSPAARPAFCTSSHVNGNPNSARRASSERRPRASPHGSRRSLQVAEERRERALRRHLHHEPRVPAGGELLDPLDEGPKTSRDRADELARGRAQAGAREARTSPTGPALRRWYGRTPVRRRRPAGTAWRPTARLTGSPKMSR